MLICYKYSVFQVSDVVRRQVSALQSLPAKEHMRNVVARKQRIRLKTNHYHKRVQKNQRQMCHSHLLNWRYILQNVQLNWHKSKVIGNNHWIQLFYGNEQNQENDYLSKCKLWHRETVDNSHMFSWIRFEIETKALLITVYNKSKMYYDCFTTSCKFVRKD